MKASVSIEPRFTFAHPGSAALEIATPHPSGPARDYVNGNGLGVWLTGLLVSDPDAIIAAALNRGAKRAMPGTKHLQHILEHDPLPGCLVAVERFPEVAARR